MSLSPSYAPPNETHSDLINEHANLADTWIECIAFGMEILLYILTTHRILTSNAMQTNRRTKWIYLIFITVQLILVTLGIAGNLQSNALSFVWNRNYPGGPLAFGFATNNSPVSFMSFASFTISTWMQDAFLLYRFLIIWHTVIGSYFLFAIPLLAFITSVIFALLLLVSEGTNAGRLQSITNLPLGLVFFSTSIGLNFILTSLIVLRIWYFKQRVHDSLGKEYTHTYLSIMSMLVESAACYTIVGIAFIVAFGINNGPVTAVLIGLYGVMTAFAPTLIAFKVSRGEAWTRETGAMSSIKFAPNTASSRTRTTGTALESGLDDMLQESKVHRTKFGISETATDESLAEKGVAM